MKVVEYEKDTTSVAYQALRGLGIVAAVFSLVVCVLMIANNLNVKRLDPVHSPALQQLVEQLRSNPQDEALKEEIRELDLLTRKAFFTSQHFNRTAVILLLGGLAVMIVSFKALRAYQPSPPYPDSREPKDDLEDNARWARKSVMAAGLFLVGFALMLALPWESPLDQPLPEEASGPAAATASGVSDSASLAPAVTSSAFPTQEERSRQWPVFLGENGAHSPVGKGPVDWNVETGEGVVWKVEVPLPGFGSPIVWKNKVFLSGANETTREVYCFDTETGEQVWTRTVEDVPGSPVEPPDVMEDTGFAAPTVATDGLRVYAIFANGDLAAFDLEGTFVWQKNLGLPENPYGYSCSLVTFEDSVIVQMDREEDSFVAAYDGATGRERWKTSRDFGPSWASPRLIDAASGPQLVLAAAPSVVAYDPRNGTELWRLDCLEGGEVAPSPVFADGILYLAADYTQFTAFDVKAQKIVWQQSDLIPGLGTPLVANGAIFFGLAEGGIVCLDANNGELLWEAETDEYIYSSPMRVGEHVYLVDRAGGFHIFKASGSSHQSVGAPELGEDAVSTPVATDSGFFVRGVQHLFRFQ